MRIQYRRTFSQFIDTYLSTYYGQSALTRVLTGPFLFVVGGIAVIFGLRPDFGWFLRAILLIAGALIFLRGLMLMLRPAMNIFLVWLRRDEFLGEENATITIELHEEHVSVDDPDGSFDIPLEMIIAVSRRTDGAWIVTDSDNIVYLPREDLLEGNHDEFIDALETAISPEEETE